MRVSEEFVYWRDEEKLNLNMHGGTYPAIRRSSYPTKYTKLYYCYYTDRPGQWDAIMSDAIMLHHYDGMDACFLLEEMYRYPSPACITSKISGLTAEWW